ncbi:MAG: EI24 domain-containing protein [Oligoflexia bacterium]|nr:EI24 domain-containing protein [Oligoflexia bacterium]
MLTLTRSSPLRLSRTESLRYGAVLPWQALKLIARDRVLLFWSAVPLLITVGLYTWLLGSLKAAVKGMWLHAFLSWGWNPGGFVADLVLLFSDLFVFLAGALTFSIAAGIVASPFNDLLAEKTEPRATPVLPPVPAQSFRTKVRLIWVDLLKALATTSATILALLLSWIPLVNLVAFAVALLLMTFQYISYPQTRRGIGLGAGLGFLWRHFYACLGFGAALSLFYALPIVSVLALPAAVVGGTLLVARSEGEIGLR